MRKMSSFGVVSATLLVAVIAGLPACSSTGYKATPVGFELPERYPNATQVAGATVGAHSYTNAKAASQAFGFDVIDAGLLPVQVVFDNRGQSQLTINPAQTFLENEEGKLWPVLNDRFAYDRVTKYAQTKQIFRQGSYGGFLGGVGGALVGAAIGVVTGGDVGESAGRGAAAGAAGGAVMGGGAGASEADRARQRVMDDFNAKSLQNRSVKPGDLAYGFIFFPAEARTAKSLRLQLLDHETKKPYTVTFKLSQ